jgi:multiple sugar transport system permease protein/raffinose/stachyose/melibiose transport system permease protein
MASVVARSLRAGHRRRALADMAMSVPAITLFGLLMVVPMGLSVYLSFTNWNGYSPNPAMVGAANYLRILHDPEVLHAALVTGVLAVVGTIGCNVLGLAVAVAINRPGRANRVLRAVFFYPYVISALIIGFLWSAILGTDGVLNSFLTAHGHEVLPFLSDPNWALGSLVGVILWAGSGLTMVLYIAGLQTVPVSLLEAARIDGASGWMVFRKVTLPMIGPIVTVNLVLVLVSMMRIYELVLALTGGGPAGRTETAAYLILGESFQNNALGYGSAQATVLTVATGALALMAVTARKRRDAAVTM